MAQQTPMPADHAVSLPPEPPKNDVSTVAQPSWSFGMLVRDLLGSPLEVVAKQQALRSAEQFQAVVQDQVQAQKRIAMTVPTAPPSAKKETGGFRLGGLFGGSGPTEHDLRKQLKEYE